MGRPAHILLHHQHARGRLDIQTAAVKDHALADNRHLRMALLAPADIDQPRRPVCGSADGVDHREIPGQKRLALDDLDLRFIGLGKLGRRIRKLFRAEVVGRPVDQITGQPGRLGNPAHFVLVRTVRPDQLRLEARLFLELVELVMRQRPSRRGTGCRCGAQLRIEIIAALRQSRRQRRQIPEPAARLFLLLDAEQHPREPAIRIRQKAGRPGCRREIRFADPACDPCVRSFQPARQGGRADRGERNGFRGCFGNEAERHGRLLIRDNPPVLSRRRGLLKRRNGPGRRRNRR